jgi:hypothetical protein
VRSFLISGKKVSIFFTSSEKIEHTDRTTKPHLLCVAKKRNNNGEEPLRRAEEEEEEGEGKSCSGGFGGYGAVEAWTDEVVDRIGFSSGREM